MTPAKDAASCETGGTACGKSFGPTAICSEWPALITAFVGNTSIGSSIDSPGDTGSTESFVNQTLLLSVLDDGIGGAGQGRGSGLVGLRDRVEALGGSLEITSKPGVGTSLVAALPIRH